MKLSDFIFAIVCGFFVVPALADDCLSYKLDPKITTRVPTWQKEVVQPLQQMDMLHGHVIATLVEDYEITGDTTSIEDGFCVGIKSIIGTIGYSDFLVRIDARHVPESCSYNAILTHEDEHIRAYLSVIDDYKKDIEASVYAAANSVMPVFVQTEAEIAGALDILHQKLSAHPELILMNQKIQAEQELRNKRIDLHEDGAYLNKCGVLL